MVTIADNLIGLYFCHVIKKQKVMNDFEGKDVWVARRRTSAGTMSFPELFLG